MRGLSEFVARATSDWLLDILRGQRLRSVFQPIVRVRANGRVGPNDGVGPNRQGINGNVSHGGDGLLFGYECLMRADVDGATIAAGPILDMARRADLLFQLDLAARRAAITGAAEHHIREKVFVNFTPNAIYDPVSCLKSTLRMIDELGLDRGQLVFEIVEGGRLPATAYLKRLVDFYRAEGFGVALDDVGAGYSSLNNLLALRPDYAKIDMELMRGVDADPAKAVVARNLIATAHELGATVVAEGSSRMAS